MVEQPTLVSNDKEPTPVNAGTAPEKQPTVIFANEPADEPRVNFTSGTNDRAEPQTDRPVITSIVVEPQPEKVPEIVFVPAPVDERAPVIIDNEPTIFGGSDKVTQPEVEVKIPEVPIEIALAPVDNTPEVSFVDPVSLEPINPPAGDVETDFDFGLDPNAGTKPETPIAIDNEPVGLPTTLAETPGTQEKPAPVEVASINPTVITDVPIINAPEAETVAPPPVASTNPEPSFTFEPEFAPIDINTSDITDDVNLDDVNARTVINNTVEENNPPVVETTIADSDNNTDTTGNTIPEITQTIVPPVETTANLLNVELNFFNTSPVNLADISASNVTLTAGRTTGFERGFMSGFVIGNMGGDQKPIHYWNDHPAGIVIQRNVEHDAIAGRVAIFDSAQIADPIDAKFGALHNVANLFLSNKDFAMNQADSQDGVLLSGSIAARELMCKECDFVTWGIWSSHTNNSTSSTDLAVHQQILPFVTGEITKNINAIAPQIANYSGNVIGTIAQGNTLAHTNGTFNTQVDMGSRRFNNFQANIGDIAFGFNNPTAANVIQSNGDAIFNKIAVTGLAGTNGTGHINGAFFGPNAQDIGGNFNFNSTSANAAGIFIGTQK